VQGEKNNPTTFGWADYEISAFENVVSFSNALK